MERSTFTAIKDMNHVEIRELISNFEEFESIGMIGECKLRTLTESMPLGHNHVTMYMNLLAMECYRYFANKYLTSLEE